MTREYMVNFEYRDELGVTLGVIQQHIEPTESKARESARRMRLYPHRYTNIRILYRDVPDWQPLPEKEVERG